MSEYKFKKGDKVILHEHEEVNGEKNWGGTMDQWIGKEATLIMPYGDDGYGCLCWETNITHNFVWREISMTLVGATQSKPQASGAKCTRCLEWYEYAAPAPDFKCYGCRH